MNRVNFSAEEVPLPAWSKKAKTFVNGVLEYLNKDRWSLSVMFCADGRIKDLNQKFRKKNEATDILTFNLGETENGFFLPGDIAISLDTLAENSAYFKVTPDEELRRLLIHGILHLDGMDHKTNGPGEPMLRLQEKILADLAGVHII